MAANDEGAILNGAYGPGNIPSELLKYDKDKAGGLLYLKRGTTKLMHMIGTQFGKRKVTSFTPKWFDVGELDSIFTVTAAQADTDAGFLQFEVSNAQAIQLQPGDILSVVGMFLADGRDGGTAGTYSRQQTAEASMEEQMLVVENPTPDSSRTGYAYVKVRRGYVNSQTTGRLMSAPSRQADGLLQSGDTLMHTGNAQWTGSDAPRGYSKNIEVDSNPLQIMRFAFEEQNETSLEKTFLTESVMSINQKLALNKMAYTLEYRALFNRPVKEQQEGSYRYAMGGLFDFIPSSNYVDYSKGGTVNAFDWMNWQRNVMAPIFELGGSSDKTAFCSIDSYTNLAMLLWNKVSITVNSAWSQKFGFEIYKIAGGGGELNLVPSWVYGRNRFRASQMLVLDFGGPYFKIDVMEDLHINKGPGGNGLQLPGQEITKFEYKAILGLQRRAKQYHAVITGLPTL